MARANVEQQMKRLRLKKEELDLRVKAQDNKQRLKEIRSQLRSVGGRIR